METTKEIINEIEYEQEVSAIFEVVVKMPEVAEALELLDQLSENLFYHNKKHTLDVIKETILFAVFNNEEKEVIDEQVIAAAWHDVGYTKQSKNHEEASADLFKQSMAFNKLSEETRNEVLSNILDTEIVIKNNEPFLSKKKSKYKYVSDADVSNFGRKDFFELGKLFAKEGGNDLSNIESKKKFLRFSYMLLKNHNWKTRSAKLLRQKQKEANLLEIERQLKELE